MSLTGSVIGCSNEELADTVFDVDLRSDEARALSDVLVREEAEPFHQSHHCEVSSPALSLLTIPNSSVAFDILDFFPRLSPFPALFQDP